MATRKRKTQSEYLRLLKLARPADEMRRYYERSLELQRREVEALEQVVYLLDHWPHGLSKG
jgi:hypothetical protein